MHVTTSDRRQRPIEASSERTLESLALAAGAAAFVGGALVALLVFRLQAAPIAGPGSVGQFSAIAAAVAAILAFVAGRVIVREPGHRIGVLDVVDVAALAFAHAVIALLTWTLLAVILEKSFIDAEVYPLPIIVVAGAVAAVTAYIVFFSATHFDLQLLALVLAVFLAEGIMASMLTASDPHWWQENLSQLGVSEDLSALAFNLTLIVAGVVVVALARFATRAIPAVGGGRGQVRTCLILVGVFLACVGIFHVDDFFWIHTGVASGMGVAFGVLVILLPRWVPGMSRGFYAVGWLFFRFVYQREWREPDRVSTIELPRWFRRAKAAPTTPTYHVNVTPPSREDLRAEVDRILDKINSQGFGVLTPEEKRRLDEAKNLLSRQ